MYNSHEIEFSSDFVKQYSVLVKKIAHHLLGKLPATIYIEDLIQSGMIGLIEAYKKFDESKGASFETYAGIRIRGAMLDEVRKGDWVPRSVHKNSRNISAAIQKVENSTGRDAKPHEIAKELNVDLDEYYNMLKNSQGAKICGFDDVGLLDDTISEGISNSIPTPSDKVYGDKIKKDLAKEIHRLPQREKLVLTLYYEEELNLREIGEVIGVSESRVSQIHSQAMLRMQSRLAVGIVNG